MMVSEWESFDFESLFSKHGTVGMAGRRRKKDKRYTMDIYCAFDIETSTVWLDDDRSKYDVHSFMYSWAFQIEEYTFTGREWESFTNFLHRLYEALKYIKDDLLCETEPKLIIWVHNLAYEFTWLSSIYPFRDDECFFRDIRKPIYCKMWEVFEFRCSYIQTNLSLSMLCKQMGVPEKLSGQKFNYDKIRFPWTPLTEYERDYIVTDVDSLVKAMKKRVQQNGDTLVTVPLTSTGYVRRDCKEALKGDYAMIKSILPDERQFRLLRRAFRGGNTHANKKHAGRIVSDVNSYDIVSCYPTQQLTMKFPMKKFKWLDCRLSLDRVFKFIGLGYAVVGLYQFKGLRLKKKNTAIPYISFSRCDCRAVDENNKIDYKLDNGRVLECGYLEIALTEIDLQIILKQYYYDEIAIVECMVAQKDYLPAEYRKVIQEYYNNKTRLKGYKTDEEEYLYTKSKNMLNSVYGMSATSPIHQEVLYNAGQYKRRTYEGMTEEEIDKALMSAPFPYQWGVYTTALSRLQLQQAIDFCPQDRLVYCDTDSIKVIGTLDIDKLNKPHLEKALQTGAYADDRNGNRHYIGLFEQDAHYDRFITQGAKRYAYEKEGHLGVTVSGVTKKRNEKTGEYFAVEELKTLDRFSPGMTWKEAGGTMAVYNDNDDFEYTDPDTGKSIKIGKNVSIIPTTYTLTYAKDYNLLLKEIQLYGEYKSERE